MSLFYCAARLITVLAAVPTTAAGSEFVQPDMKSLIREANYIARVKLLGREPWQYRGSTGEILCGYVYDSEVVEELKGPRTTTLRFFGGDQLGKPDAGDVLVFLFRRDEAELRGMLRRVDPLKDSARSRLCELAASELQLRSNPLTMSQFDVVLGQSEGGPWLVDREFDWLNLTPAMAPRWEYRDGERRALVPWLRIRELIDSTLREPAQ